MDDSGLGIQTWEFYRHMNPHKVLAIDYDSFNGFEQHPERYPDAAITKSIPTPPEVNRFLTDVDVVFSCETPYAFSLLEIARFKGIKTVIQPNYEFFRWIKEQKFPRPDLFGLPSPWHWNDIPFDNKVSLPVPIATDRFVGMTDKPDLATNFLHIVGKPAANNRNGTDILLKALKFVESEITLTIRCFDTKYLNDLLEKVEIPKNVTLRIDNEKLPNYWDQYKDQHCLIMPRRYGGLCLPVNEAIGANMPVIMPDIDPNNKWLPEGWLVDAKPGEYFQSNTRFQMFETYQKPLARRIDRMATDKDFYRGGVYAAMFLAKEYSWDNLQDDYTAIFEDLLQFE